jgi:predicted nucleic acid-binding protein
MPDKKPQLFFDTVVLSNFALTKGGVLFLKKRYGNRGIITLQVFQEIAKATFANWSLLEQIEKNLIVKSGFHKTSLNEKEQAHFIPLLRNLGEGEASCIACAQERQGIVVTDDRAARNHCKERDVLISGTIGILKAACLDTILDKDQADRMLTEMISFGFYSPVKKISDIL